VKNLSPGPHPCGCAQGVPRYAGRGSKLESERFRHHDAENLSFIFLLPPSGRGRGGGNLMFEASSSASGRRSARGQGLAGSQGAAHQDDARIDINALHGIEGRIDILAARTGRASAQLPRRVLADARILPAMARPRVGQTLAMGRGKGHDLDLAKLHRGFDDRQHGLIMGAEYQTLRGWQWMTEVQSGKS